MTSLPIFLRAATKFQEIDLTQRIDVILSTMGVIVGEFERGPVEPTYQSGNDEDFRKLYGPMANPKIGFAYDTATTFMTQSGNLLIKRITKNALYAGASLFIDTASSRLLIVPFTTGVANSYSEEGFSASVLINIAGTYTTGGTFAMDITDGVTLTTTATVTYATSHNATMTAIAAAIQTTLNSFGAGSTAVVYSEPTGGNNHLIIIRVAKTVSLDFSNIVVVGAGIVATMDETPKALDVFAENPGTWGNDIGIRVSNIDAGVKERYNLSFAGPLVTSNSVSVTINGTTVTQVFDTDSDNTLELLAASIDALATVEQAVVQTVPGGVDNDRTILIIAKTPGPDKLVFTGVAVTLGASQVAASVAKVMTGINADNSFTLETFSRSNTNSYLDSYVVSLQTQLDSRGYQQNISNKVNRSSTKSVNIRVLQPATIDRTMYDTSGSPISVPSTIIWLAGGTNGVAATSAELRAGWDALDDRVQYPFNVMLNAGYTSISVQKKMAEVAEKRSDCIAILDAPADRQGAQDLRSYRLNELDIDSTYAAMYSPDIEIEDDRTGERRFIPPSGPVGATYAYSDRLTNFVGAPAGLNRGKVTVALGLRHRYTIAEQELLNPSPININTIIDKPGSGPTVWAEQTLQVKNTILSSVHARRILNYIKTGLVDGLDYTLFEPNTASTRFNAVQLGKTILEPMTDGDGNGGLYAYRIKCDDQNNTDAVKDADQLAYDVYLQIVRVIKGILVRGILTRTGANFDEIVL